MKRFVYIFLICFSPAVAGHAQVLTNAEKAFSIAGNSQRAILLIFSGSDWCQPCIRFHKTILADSAFQQFANKELVILEADFPQRKKMTKDLVAQNEALAQQYNPSGAFPRLLLLNPDKSVITVLEYNNQTSPTFVQQVSRYLQNANMLKEYSRRAKLMGSAFEFIVVAENDNAGDRALTTGIKEVQRIEALLTEFNDNSETSLINRNAGIHPVAVSDETYQLIKRSHDISQLTSGAFDISAGALKKLYNFKGENFSLPDKAAVKEALTRTGYEKIQLTPPGNVYLSAKAMHIGFAAIGKGYAAGKVKRLLQHQGIESGVINASGDLTAWGTRPNGNPWKTGIAHPDDPTRILLWLPVNGLSVATSGNYIQYFDLHGTRYSHNIDPLTGYPVKGIKSVSIVSPGAELSDALATAVTVMGVKTGLHFINQLPQTHCLIVDENNNVHTSKNIDVQHAT